MLVMYTSLTSGYLTLQTEALYALASTDSISYDRIIVEATKSSLIDCVYKSEGG